MPRTGDLGTRIYNLRAPNGVARYSQAELGKAIGVNAMTVSRWERSLSEPQPRHLRTLADFFGVPVSYFFVEYPIATVV